MRVLVVTGYGVRLSVDNGLILIQKRGSESIRVNPIDVESIIVETSGASITTSLVRLAASMGITISIIDGRTPPIIISPVYHVKHSETRRAQYACGETACGAKLASSLVASKIMNQANCLRLLNVHREDAIRRTVDLLLAKSNEALRINYGESWRNELRHIEAEAARMYWGAIAILLPRELRFDGRDHDSSDPFNAALNYVYSILYSECFKRLSTVGLDPFGGIFHADKAGRMSLVYDVSDPLKPIIDYFLVRASRTTSIRLNEDLALDDDSKKKVLTAYNEARKCMVKLHSGETMPFSDAIGSLAFRLAGSLRRGESTQNLFTISWR